MEDKLSKKLLNTSLISILSKDDLSSETIPFDEYHLVMAQTDFITNKHEHKAVKTYFYRVPPFRASYVVVAGIIAFINKINSFSFKNIVEYLERCNYKKEFIDYIKTRDKLNVEVFAVTENSIVFPSEPILIIRSSLLDSRLIEDFVLHELNFPSLIATKWNRIKTVSKSMPLFEFGRRRAQNSLKASLYSYYSGVVSTSNCEASFRFGIKASGTMGHEFIQSSDNEREAFDSFINVNPTTPILLVDTINTLESGVVHAIDSFRANKELLIKNNSWHKIGIRIDSGDLAYLAVSSYKKMKESLRTDDINIVLSNDLDEYNIESIINQIQFADEDSVLKHISFGVGTRGATGWGSPALGGICKLSELDNRYIMKISNNSIKTTIPGECRSATLTNSNGEYITTLIYLKDENIEDIKYCVDPLDDTNFMELSGKGINCSKEKQRLVYSSMNEKGIFIDESVQLSLTDICKNQEPILSTLDWTYKRILNPHRAKVSLSSKLFELRSSMIKSSSFYKHID